MLVYQTYVKPWNFKTHIKKWSFFSKIICLLFVKSVTFSKKNWTSINQSVLLNLLPSAESVTNTIIKVAHISKNMDARCPKCNTFSKNLYLCCVIGIFYFYFCVYFFIFFLQRNLPNFSMKTTKISTQKKTMKTENITHSKKQNKQKKNERCNHITTIAQKYCQWSLLKLIFVCFYLFDLLLLCSNHMPWQPNKHIKISINLNEFPFYWVFLSNIFFFVIATEK